MSRVREEPVFKRGYDCVYEAERESRKAWARCRYADGAAVMRGDEVAECGRGSETLLVIGYESDRRRAMVRDADGHARMVPFGSLSLVSRKAARR